MRWIRLGVPLVAALLLAPPMADGAEARARRSPPRVRAALDPAVGRNAGPAIVGGLAGMTDNWIDTIGNAVADPARTQSDPFAYYRRRTYGGSRR